MTSSLHDQHVEHGPTERQADHAAMQAGQHDHGAHHEQPTGGGINAMAASATLHCLTGCAIGEIAGLIIGTALGLGNVATIALAIALAFLFGYALSTLPLVKAGLGFLGALSVVLAADTLSIATMEIVDNAVMAAIPGAMDAGLSNPVFWLGMMVALTAAFIAAYPVNRYLLGRGKGHALTHRYHHGGRVTDWRRFIPSFGTGALAAAIIAFMLGGLIVAGASGLDTGGHGAVRDVRTVEVSMTDELTFEPDTITVARGETVRFEVTNTGESVHEFLVGDEAAQAEFADEMSDGEMDHDTATGVSVDPGQTETFDYTFGDAHEVILAGCHEPGHYEAGMVATITVGD
ncbi:MAG: DUF4396 domain-containing protein [Chloroflexota bacterium]|nr:DUF4396 domain-containing protein [Chloroflexota bacterium]